MSHPYATRKLKTISYIWISFPLTYLFYSFLVLGLGGRDVVKLILSPGYWFVSIIAVVAGVGLLNIRWYAWYMFVFSNLLVAYQTASSLVYYSHYQVKLLLFILTLLGQIVLTYIIGREVRVPYFFPRIRWWESDPRYKLSVQTTLTKADKSSLDAEIMDISMGGCFIKTNSDFKLDEPIKLNFLLFEQAVECTGKIVWSAESSVTHPKGIGVKFFDLDKNTLFCLKQASKKLKKLARVYTQLTREKNWKEYLQREQKYQGESKS